MAETKDITVRPANKTLAIFLDGTWNVHENNTNVWRLYSSCAKEDKQGRKQVLYYSKGVGTSYGETIRGGVTGFGIDTLIKDAYEWLVANYDDNRGDDKFDPTDADADERDKLFIFGFSRGAYAARSLAGFVARCGLPQPGSPIGIGELYARSLRGNKRTLYRLRAERKPEDVFEEWMLQYCRPVDITMVGVWDTVGALRGAKGYRETGLRLPIKHLFQALAIDEHRPTFAPTLWTVRRSAPSPRDAPGRPPPVGTAFKLIPLKRVEQRWFVGAHANVGGGYNSDLLPQLPLQWIMEKAGALGLAFRKVVDFRDTDRAHAVHACPIADSFRMMAGGAYYALKLGRPYLRPIGTVPTAADDTLNVNETVDRSVFERWRRNPDYLPRNLQAWATSHRVDIEHMTRSASALNPKCPLDDGPEGPPLRLASA